MIDTTANLVALAPGYLDPFLHQAESGLATRVAQTHLGGGHLVDGFLSE
jgi:hypothetical protein